MVHVYVLRSESSGRLYVGHTANLERRFGEHNAGHCRSTRGRGPWTVVASTPFDTRGEAMTVENELKRLKKPAAVLERIALW